MCTCALALCVHVCLHSLCMSLQNLGEESLLILARGHNPSLPPPIHGSPSIPRKCSGSCGDEMRTDVYHPQWRQHHHQPRPPSPSFNDERAALACVSAVLSPPRWFICTCLGVFNGGGTFIRSPPSPLAFSLTCRRTESGDGWRASIHTIWNYPSWWYLAVINLIKALLFLWYDHPVYQCRPQLLLQLLAVPVTHYLPATCTNMRDSLWIPLMLGWTLE